MRFLKRDGEGELELDHTSSPGLPPGAAIRRGFEPGDVAEGTVHRVGTMYCPHCGSHVVLNPERQRARNTCMKCNSYICDNCAAAMHDPDYVHHTFMEIVDKVNSGRFTVVGNSMSTLRLVPIGEGNG
jgi:phage terminase large subunit GpA-like protein